MKKVISSILAAAMASMALAGILPAALATEPAAAGPAMAEAKKVADADINWGDATLTEWTNVPKNYMSVYEDGKLTVSDQYYVQFTYSGERLYYAAVLPSSGEKTAPARDTLRMLFKLPDGKLNAFYTDTDDPNNHIGGWINATDGMVLSWDGINGLNGDFGERIFLHDNTAANHKYENGTVTFEGSLNLKEDLRAALAEGNEIGISVRYHENTEFNLNGGDNILVWGDDDLDFTNNAASDTFGRVTLAAASAPTEPYVRPEITADKSADTAVIWHDGKLTEWDNSEKLYMSSYKDGKLTTSTTDYIQFKWSEERIYMAMSVTDGGKSVNGAIRDSVRVAFSRPDGKVSYFYVDSDGTYGWVRYVDDDPTKGVLSWCGDQENDNIFLDGDNTGAKFEYTNDGRATLEVTMKLLPEFRNLLLTDNTIGISVRYHDNAAFDTLGGDNILVWGDDDLDFTNNAADHFGLVTFGPEVEQGGEDQGDGHITPVGVNKVDIEKGSAMIDGIEDVIWKKVSYLTPEIAHNFQHEPSGWGPTDTTGKWKALWDEKGVYFWVEVADSTKNLEAESGQTFDKDSIIVYIDQINQDQGPYGPECPSPTGSSPFLIGANGECFGSGNGKMDGTTLNIITKETETGYIYEGFIGWTISDAAKEGNYIGLDIDINDNINGTGRDAVVFWNTLNTASGNWNLTNGYADAKLVNSGIGGKLDFVESNTTAKVNEAETLPDGTSKKITWEATEGTYEYQINLFSLNEFDETEKFFVDTYKVYGGETSFSFTDLALDTMYAFQILAYDAEGNLLAAYAPGEFDTTFDFGGGDGDGDGDNNGGDISGGDNTGDPDGDGNGDVPQTGVEFAYAALIVLIIAAGAVVFVRKKANR